MTGPFWPLAVSSWGPRERAAAHAVIDGDHQTMGARVREFEAAFARHVGAKHAVMTNSGSSANLLMVAAMRYLFDYRPRYLEVIVPAIAWATTYAPLQQHGYRLVVCDVDPRTLNIDVAEVRAAITPATVAVVGVSILGNPAPLPELEALCTEHGLLLLEDNCESLGAKIGDRYCGTFGAAGTFSFFFSHHLSTAEGGALVTDDAAIYELAVCLRAHGWSRDLPPNSSLRPIYEADDLGGAYQFLIPGYNVRPTELTAAVGLVQLDRLADFEDARRANHQLFVNLFSGDERWEIQHPNGRAVPFGFTLVLRTPEARGRASRALTEAGIEHRLITGGSFARHPAAGRYSWRYATERGAPHADHAHDRGLFVGNHAADLTEQIQMLHKILDEVIK